MSLRLTAIASACAVLAAGLTLTPIAQASPPDAYKAPRNAAGQPDLSGYWSNATLTPTVRDAKLGDRLIMTPDEVKAAENAEAVGIEAGNKSTDTTLGAPAAGSDPGGYNRGWIDHGHTVMRVGGQPRTSLITTKNGQVPPRKDGQAAVGPGAGAGARRGGGLGSFDNPENRPLGERCIIGFGRNGGPPMFPNGFYNNNYNIVQTRDAVAIQVEMVHDTRIVRLNTKHRTDGVRPWFGDSIGWWDGDTLVVETTNIPQAQAYNGSWTNLTVTERFTRTAKDRLRYQFTVSDPTLWDKPWGGEYEFGALQGIIYEYACHEGNYALPGILAGARNDEAKAGKTVAAR